MKAETLKKAILQYAMQGKLVEQNPEDEPASVLLERIKAEKEQLIKDGKIKKEKPLPPISEDEIPYELPKGWEWCRLGELVSISTGQYDANHARDNGEYAFFTCSYTPMKCDTYSYEGQGILLPGNGANVGLSIFYEGKFDAYQRTYVLQGYSNLFLKYIHYMLMGNWKEYNANKLYGGATPYIKLGNIENYLVALPPIQEQERIVEKLEQILPLVEEYGKNEEKLSKLNSTLPDKIKQSILQYAVQGKLVPQNPSDEPASELLKRIKVEKEQLIKEGKIKKEKPLPPITEDEIPFQIPDSWKWVRLSQITSIIGDGIHGTPEYTLNTEYYFINGNNLNNGIIEIKDNTKTVSENEYLKYKKDLSEKTVLVSINGTLGNVAFYNNEKVMLGKSACYFNLLSDINKLYLKLILNSDYFLKYADNKATGTTIKNVSLKAMQDLLIPLPPLAEQKRIVTKVEEFMNIVDKLKN